MRKRHLPQLLLALLSIIFIMSVGKISSFAHDHSVAEEPKYHSLNIYDSDRETLLSEPVVVEENLESPYTLWDLLENKSDNEFTVHDIQRIVNGYQVVKYRVERKSHKASEFSFWKEFTVLSLQLESTASKFDLARYDYNFYAIYKSTPVNFPIKYELNGGTNPTEVPVSMSVAGPKAKLPKPTRAKYVFEGWYMNSKFSPSLKITSVVPAHCLDLDYDDSFKTPSITVYAKWKKVVPDTPKIRSVKNSSSGQAKVTLYNAAVNPLRYEVQCSSVSTFKSNLRTITVKPGDAIVFNSLAKGKKYYIRVRAYNKDSRGSLVYSKFSDVKKVEIKTGESEVKPTSKSAKLTAVKAAGKTTKFLTATATVAKRVKSKDDFYYLVKVDPYTNEYRTAVTKVEKTSKPTFKIPFTEANGNNYYAGKYAVAVLVDKDKYKIISSSQYISNPEGAAKYTGKYPTPKSKKGRQGIYSKDDGDKHYFYNILLNNFISSKAEGGEPFKYNGKTYYFKAYNSNLDNSISYVNKDGGTVTLQLMLKYDDKVKSLIKSTARSDHHKNYYAFNVETAAARNQIEAAFYWIAKHYSQPDLHVDNWILGNEVNSFRNPIGWYWAGNISNDEFIKNYAQTFRILYYAVKSNSKYARVFTSVDHTFNNRGYEWGVRNFLVAFDKELKALDPHIQWNLAYHAYSAVLTNADFWNDNTSPVYTTSNNYATDFISPLNIEVLVKYVRENFGKNVHIILSEQAFSSTPGTDPGLNGGRQAGEDVQAAAVTYLFYKVMFNKDIDSVIYAHPLDNLGPGMDFSMKPTTFNMYRIMDTPKYGETIKCITTIQKRPGYWKQLVPDFDDSVLRSMPSR